MLLVVTPRLITLSILATYLKAWIFMVVVLMVGINCLLNWRFLSRDQKNPKKVVLGCFSNVFAPVVVVEDLNSAIGWHQSGHEIADAACTRWTQLVSDKANSRYTHIDLDDQSSVPNKPEFTTPPVDYQTAIFKAFKGRIIDSEDHPVYKNAGSVVQTTYSKNKLVGSVKN
jgi:hypothetical protein